MGKRIVVVVFIINLISLNCFSNESYQLVRPDLQRSTYVSGDKQHGSVSRRLNDDLVYFVVDQNNEPVSGVAIKLELISFPENSERPEFDSIIYTDSLGLARTSLTLGSKKGEYEILARIDSTAENNFLVYKFFARSKGWLFSLFMGLLGGLALFLYGMYLLGEGLMNSAGFKLRNLLSTLTQNKVLGVLVGTGVTVVVQSSSATSVILVSFVHSKIIKFKQTLSVLLGAAIGTTITAQLIAFKVTDYSLVAVAIGAGVFFFSVRSKIKNVGLAVLGAGILFYGMGIMSDAMVPMRSFQPFLNLVTHLENPILGILVGAFFTALIQSSGAFIGILIILAGQGLLSLESSLALILGANLGTPITAILASIKTSVESKKVAYSLLFYKLFQVFLFIGIIPYVADFLNYMQCFFTATECHSVVEILPRQIANAHTIFNVIVAIIALPLINPYAKFIDWLFQKQLDKQKTNIKFLTESLNISSTFALSVVKKETINMTRRLRDVLDKIIHPFFDYEERILLSIQTDREDIKEIRDVIKEFLLKYSRTTTDQDKIKESYMLLHSIVEFSHINDSITKVLHRRAEKWIEGEYALSDSGRAEILDIYTKTKVFYDLSIEYFESLNDSKLYDIDIMLFDINAWCEKYENFHYQRLIAGDSHEIRSSKTYLELLNMLQTICQHSYSVVRIYSERNI